MARIDVIQSRMIRTMPMPEPTGGPRLGRTRLQAAAIGGDPIATLDDAGAVPGHEAQTANAIEQMSEGATLVRVPSHDSAYPTPNPIAAESWDPEQAAYWGFEPANDDRPGAQGIFLDWWGSMLQVPRIAGEADASYRQRIPMTIMRPGITNKGMALLIDQLLGIPTFTGGVFTGTRVIDAANFLNTSSLRANDHHRANDGLRAATIAAYSVTGTWNCFIVVLPSAIPAGFTDGDINDLVDRVRAAGNRKIATIIPSTHTTIPTPVHRFLTVL